MKPSRSIGGIESNRGITCFAFTRRVLRLASIVCSPLVLFLGGRLFHPDFRRREERRTCMRAGERAHGDAALVYRSSAVSVHPIIQVNLPTDNSTALPTYLNARLTFDGTAAPTVTYSTGGMVEGDVF